MKRFVSFSLATFALIVVAALALSLPLAPAVAQDGTTPTPTPDPMTGPTGMDQPVIIGNAQSEEAQVALRYLENPDVTLLAETVTYRDWTQAQPLTLRDDIVGPANLLNSAFSDHEITIKRVIIAENTVVVEYDFTGVHTGTFLGAEPTGQTVTVEMVAIFEVEDGLITRIDVYYDAATLARALGFTLQPPGAALGPDVTGPATGDDAAQGDEEDVTALAPSLVVEDQTVREDGSVLIARAVSPVNGWVVIHADDSGRPGTVIGYAPVAAGDTRALAVPIDSNAVTATLFAMLHVDEGTAGTYEFPGDDVPLTDAQGNPVVAAFAVSAPEGTSAQTVDVTLIDGQIQMPTSLAAGRILFNVANSGTMAHSFEIEGEGVSQALASTLQPGETATLDIELQPGTYEVYCPVDDHAEQGMRLELTVQ